ncbi:MAG: PQQ-like beta-propeller repeat protein, partial [Planctomycetes bacterium]|nr:PQQ-like beta-propeller repeat protein [Planctomycetota bacterium]
MLTHRQVTLAILAAVLALAAAPALPGGAAPALAGDWPTLHRDYQRSGYTDEVVAGPYERKWFRDFHDEVIATRVEAIVAEGKCFVGTFAGRLHALKVEDGSTAWTFQAAGAIGHSPSYRDGKVYVGSEGGFQTGYVYALNAADGKELWRYAAGAGVWVSPACDGRRVYFGDRAGTFHAVSAADGKPAWTFKAGGMILAPASFSPDGTRIVFAAEDMHVYCLDADGRLLWKSPKCGGLSLRDHAPTVWKDLVIVRSNPAHDFHGALGMSGMKVLGETQKQIPLGPDDVVIQDKWGTYALKYTEARMEAERKAVSEYLAAHPEERTFWAFNLSDGKEPWMAPVPY